MRCPCSRCAARPQASEEPLCDAPALFTLPTARIELLCDAPALFALPNRTHPRSCYATPLLSLRSPTADKRPERPRWLCGRLV
eukprot:COSAG02_NODE_55195_length_292_cov_0.383420_1_plen_82_part_01